MPRLINLFFRYLDALQRSSALATRQDLQNKEVNGTKLTWVAVPEEVMNGTNSGGLDMEHEEFDRIKLNPELIFKNGTVTPPAVFRRFQRVSPRILQNFQ
jgi:hypothetical protein